MRTATLLKNDDSPLEFIPMNVSIGRGSAMDDHSPSTLHLPNFNSVNNELYALTSRIAGRVNAASASDEEYQALLTERQQLLDKKFDETITRREICRLEYIRWSLDRIEDAEHGEDLDRLEGAIRIYENFVDQVRDLRGQLRGAAKP